MKSFFQRLKSHSFFFSSKRNALAIFMLLGLVVLEYGCKEDDTNPDKCDPKTHQQVIGISHLGIYDYSDNVYNNVYEKDSVSYDDFLGIVNFNFDFVNTTPTYSNFGAYAIMIPKFPVCWPLSRIQVMGETDGASEDLTGKLNVRINGKDPFPITNDAAFKDRFTADFVDSYSRLSFEFKEAPSIRTPLKLRFTFTTEDGAVRGIVSDAITILP